MFHVIYLINDNAYITYSSWVEEGDRLEQKDFVLAMVKEYLKDQQL